MTRPVPTPVLHFTRIEHLATIIRDGLLPDTRAQSSGVLRQEIGHREIKAGRRTRRVPCGKQGVVADYVPFYFAPRSPMMFSISKSNVAGVDPDIEKLVYLTTTTQALITAGLCVVFTNQNARMTLARMTTDDALLDGDDFVDWPLMRARYWGNTEEDPTRKERRQAECLVQPHVEWKLIHEVVTKTKAAHDQVRAILDAAGVETSIFVRPTWYF